MTLWAGRTVKQSPTPKCNWCWWVQCFFLTATILPLHSTYSITWKIAISFSLLSLSYFLGWNGAMGILASGIKTYMWQQKYMNCCSVDQKLSMSTPVNWNDQICHAIWHRLINSTLHATGQNASKCGGTELNKWLNTDHILQVYF